AGAADGTAAAGGGTAAGRGGGVTDAAATLASSDASEAFVAVMSSGGMGSGAFKYFTKGLFAISRAITTDCAFRSAPSELVCTQSIGNQSDALSLPTDSIR